MQLVNWFRRRSLKERLILSDILLIGTTIVPVILIMMAYEYYALRTSLIEDARTHASIVSDSASSALAFRDQKTAQEILSSINGSQDTLAAALLLPDNSVFTVYRKKGVSFTDDEIKVPQEIFSYEHFTIRHAVVLQNNRVGTVVLKCEMNTLYQHLQIYVFVVLSCAIVGVMLSYWLAARLVNVITQPIRQLISITEHVIDSEDYQAMQEHIRSDDEVGQLSHSFQRMMSHIHARDVKLQQLAYYDNVTGLANRHFFDVRLADAVERAIQDETRCCLMFIDLDDFKKVNDTIGHDAGDVLLKEVGRRLEEELRTSDIVCRLGGDEFAVILENISTLEDVDAVATKLIELLAQPVKIAEHFVQVGASIGISACPDFASDTRQLLITADSAMYIAKQQGKNRFSRYYVTPA